MGSNTSWNDDWFREATKEEVKELYGDKEYLLNEALEHWKRLNPVKKKKEEEPKQAEE